LITLGLEPVSMLVFTLLTCQHLVHIIIVDYRRELV
jgi:hypothetical protein